jgi:2-keto-4-pentenoate hydratase/2-oxohepta-3-ene-1,7-dioic acid hydratase in catechol pathway
MKLLFADDYRLSVLKGEDKVVDVTDLLKDIPRAKPNDIMSGLIANWGKYKGAIEAEVAKQPGKPLASVRVRAPLPHPNNIVCMAVNYMEDGTREKPAPINAFHKASNTVIGTGETMVFADVPATAFEGEAEIALVIGKPASNVKEADAWNYIFGYMNFIDGSARGLPPSNNTYFQMKSRATMTPIGPYLVTADEYTNPQNRQVRLWVNGKLHQNYNTSDMAHKIPRCIAWVSSIHDLEPGDIIALGTNHRGLSCYQDGDKIELEVDGLGRLTIHCRDDLKRTWERGTRLERTQKGLPERVQLTGKYADLHKGGSKH